MKHLRNKTLIWIGGYFPFLPRLFGLKMLRFGYIDITPDLCSGSQPKGRIVESKVSWLIENLWETPLPVKIVIPREIGSRTLRCWAHLRRHFQKWQCFRFFLFSNIIPIALQ